MARAVERRLGNRIDSGAVVTQYGYAEKCKYIEILEAAHPVPDISGLDASQKIEKLAVSARKKDMVIFLLSGGGSALMPHPRLEFLSKINNLSRIHSCEQALP